MSSRNTRGFLAAAGDVGHQPRQRQHRRDPEEQPQQLDREPSARRRQPERHQQQADAQPDEGSSELAPRGPSGVVPPAEAMVRARREQGVGIAESGGVTPG
jgi:hypothetical protein